MDCLALHDLNTLTEREIDEMGFKNQPHIMVATRNSYSNLGYDSISIFASSYAITDSIGWNSRSQCVQPINFYNSDHGVSEM